MVPIIRSCSSAQFEEVKHYIAQFELDNRHLQQQEFLTIHNRAGLLGFGRIREYQGFSELCSLGILEAHRLHGLGKQLAKALAETAQQPLYLVCIIPKFFESLGFCLCFDYPTEIADKLNYCTQNLPVNERYVVMKKHEK